MTPVPVPGPGIAGPLQMERSDRLPVRDYRDLPGFRREMAGSPKRLSYHTGDKMIRNRNPDPRTAGIIPGLPRVSDDYP
jgi:hypothetical protein